MKKSNLYAYIICITISIVLIILNITHIENSYYGLLGSFGIGIFSSIIVATLIQMFNKINTNKLKSRQLELMNTDIKRKFISLLIIFNRVIKDINNILNTAKINEESLCGDFENKNINQVLKHFISCIEIIEKYTLISMQSEKLTAKEKSMVDCKSKIELLVAEDKMLEQVKNDFISIKNDFETRRQILIAGDYIDDETLSRLETVITLLKSRNDDSNIFNNEDISAYKYKFEKIAEVSNDKLWKALGLKGVIFENNKGWLGLKRVVDTPKFFTND